MRFTAWFKRNARPIGLIGATIVFALSFVKDNLDDARRDVEKVENAHTFYEHSFALPDAQELRSEFDTKVLGRGPSKTPAEEVSRLGLVNRNDQLIWVQLVSLKELSTALERPLDTAKIKDLLKVCDTAQADYEDIIRLFKGDTSNPPTDVPTINKINETSRKFRRESKQLVDEAPQLDREVLEHTEKTVRERTRKLRWLKVSVYSLMVFGFVLNFVSLIVGVKPTESGE